MSIKSLLKKFEMGQKPVTVSDTRKVDLTNHGFLDSLFCCPMFRRLAVSNAKKMNNSMCTKKTLII